MSPEIVSAIFPKSVGKTGVGRALLGKPNA